MNSKAGRRAAREQVACYHEACVRELIDHVASAVDRYRAGKIDGHPRRRRGDPPLLQGST